MKIDEPQESDVPQSTDANPQGDVVPRFRLSSLFVMTLIAAILTAFLNSHGRDLVLAGVVTMAACLLFGLAVGYVRPPGMRRLFWGVVIAAMIEVVCATVVLFDHDKGIYAWPLAAGFAAVVVAGEGSRWLRMIAGGVTAASLIAIYALTTNATTIDLLAIVACAAIGGALLALMIELVGWVERVTVISHPAIGLALVLAAIGFSLVGKQLIPGW